MALEVAVESLSVGRYVEFRVVEVVREVEAVWVVVVALIWCCLWRTRGAGWQGLAARLQPTPLVEPHWPGQEVAMLVRQHAVSWAIPTS